MAEASLEGLALQALAQWDLEPVRVEEVSRSENIVFRVATEDAGIFVLRMHRPEYHTFEELVSEQVWTSDLRAAGVDVPVPRLTRTGEPYGRISVLGETRYVGMLEWVEGETLGALMKASADADYAGAQFRQLGELLAVLHNQASSWQPPAGFVRNAVDEDGLMGEKPLWGPFWTASILTAEQKRRFEVLREQIHGILSGLSKSPERYSMIHADLHPDNVVANGARLHVIDFDDACFGWHAYDFAVALKNYEASPHFEDFQAALVAGYRRLRAIDDDTLALIPLFLLIRTLASLGWVDARPELGHDGYAVQGASYVDERAERVLADYL